MTSSSGTGWTGSRQQCLASAVQPDPGGHLPDVERRGRFRDGETVNRHQFKHGPFAFRQSLQHLVQLPDLPEGVDLLHQAIDVVGVEQAAPRDQPLGVLLARGPAELGGDDVARDPVQPRPRTSEGPPVPRRRLDHRQEHLGGQVSDQLRVRYAARHEPGHLVHVGAVELGERGRIGPDRPHRRLGPSTHRRPLRRLIRL